MIKPTAVLAILSTLAIPGGFAIRSQDTLDPLDKRLGGFELLNETFVDGLAKIDGQTELGIAVELPLKERLSDANISYVRFTSRVPGGTIQDVLNYLCSLDPRFSWSRYKQIINVYPRNTSVLGDKYFMNRRLSDTIVEISDPAEGIFSTTAALAGSLEQIAFSQSGALPGFSRPWSFSSDGRTLREAFDEIALHMGTGYGWTLGGANEFRVIRFHARLLPGGTPEAKGEAGSQEGSYIQVVSVAVEPHTIHAKDKPSQAVVKASLVVRGNIPSGSTATVELSTYSSEVPGVKLCYEKRIQMVALDSDFIGVEFPVTACPDTAQGKVLLGVTVQGATGHVMIKRTPSDKGQMSQLTIAVP